MSLSGIVFDIYNLQVPVIQTIDRGTRGVYTWPLISYMYNTIRTNSLGDRLRAGATCEHIRETISYFEW